MKKSATGQLSRAEHIAKYSKMKCGVKGCDRNRQPIDGEGYLDVTQCARHIRLDIMSALATLRLSDLITAVQRAKLWLKMNERYPDTGWAVPLDKPAKRSKKARVYDERGVQSR